LTVLRNLVATFGTSGLLSTSIEGVSATIAASGSTLSSNLRFEFLVVDHEQGRVKPAQTITKNAPSFAAASMPLSELKRRRSTQGLE
jgi:hypothetical protein